MLIEGLAGRFVAGCKGYLQATLTELGSIRVSQNEGEGDEQTRAGLKFNMSAIGATGIAPVQAIPATTAQWLIYNPIGSLVSAYVDQLGALLNSGVAGAGGTLYVAPVKVANVPATVPTVSAANVQIMNASNACAKGSSLIVASNQTLQNMVVGSLTPISAMIQIGTVLGQVQFDSGYQRSRWLVSPGTGLALYVVSPTGTTPLYAPFGVWRERTTDAE